MRHIQQIALCAGRSHRKTYRFAIHLSLPLLCTILFAPQLFARKPFELFFPNLEPARIQTLAPSSNGEFSLLARKDEKEIVLLRCREDGTVLRGRRFSIADQTIEPYGVYAMPDGGNLITGQLVTVNEFQEPPPTGEETDVPKNGFNPLIVVRLDASDNLL